MHSNGDHLIIKDTGAWERVRLILSRRVHYVGFVGLMLFALAMLGMQSWFLFELKESSSASSRLSMRDFLIAVLADSDEFYREAAQQLLNLRPELLTDPSSAFGARFRRRWTGSLKGMFVVNLDGTRSQQIQYYGPSLDDLHLAADSSEMRAINLAFTRWALADFQRVARPRLIVDERDEENRIILRPVMNASSQPVAVVGMIIDSEFFREQYLPAAIRRHLDRFFPNEAEDNVIVRVQDGSGDIMFKTRAEPGQGDEIIRSSSYLFADWQLSIQSRHTTPEQWAQRSFRLNLSIMALMSVLVIGGIFIIMQASFRSMKLSRMQTEFVSNVSHELKTPLSSIRVLGELLSSGRVSKPAKVREYGDYIEGESQRLTGLIDDVLDFAAIDSGKKTYRLERADVSKAVAETLQAVELGLQQTGFSIRFDASPREELCALIDKDAISEAVLNLVDNAVKYSGSAREIAVSVDKHQNFVTISVTDYGIGLSAEEAERIFEKFYRVSSGLVHNVRGSGLGLSISKHIVEAHGGKITVESEPGRGSTFAIHIPVLAV